MTYDEYKEKRADHFRKAVSRKDYKKGQQLQSHCFCSMCGKDVTNVVATTGKLYANTKFTKLKIVEFIYVNVCDRADHCYKNYNERGNTV